MSMCDFPRLSKMMFEALAEIEKGRFVYVIALKASEVTDANIEDVIVDEILDLQMALDNYCKRTGKTKGERLCLPVILPPGLHAEDVHGFRPIRTEKALWIEYTKAGPVYRDRISGN